MDTKSTLNADRLVGVLTFNNIVSLVGLWVGYRILVALYNISPLHPLSRFPGPKIASASYLYEAYYDWILRGRYTHKIREMHERYGPIVRINPDELHCSDPYFTDEIYAGPGRIRDKWQHMLNTGSAGPVGVAGFSTVSHELHRLRRAGFAKFFSRQQMLKLETEVEEFAQLTTNKILRQAGKGPFDVKEAFSCFTADVISQYCFGEPMGFLEQEGWEPNFTTWFKAFFRQAYMLRHNVVARTLTQLVPFVAEYMGEDMRNFTRQTNVVIPGYIKKTLDDPVNGRVFAEVVQSKTMPEEEKSMYRLSGEGFTFLMAGTETTAATLAVITYHLLDKPEIYARLMKDLEDVDPSKLKWTELEKKPYLWAIIQESLRVMPGVSHRSARIPRNEDLIYKSQDGSVEWVIPRDTPIGMTSMINHWNTELFPNPDEFLPERWLVNGQQNYQLQKMLISFSKGSRACLGENLAYCEVYIMSALIAFKVIPRASLYETTDEDLKYDHDQIILQTKKGSISIRIKID